MFGDRGIRKPGCMRGRAFSLRARSQRLPPARSSRALLGLSKLSICGEIFGRATLIAKIERGAAFKYVYFWRHTGAADGIGPLVFSQWREPAKFTFGGITSPSAEHNIMAEKARLFGDDAARAKIPVARSPGAAKALGRAIANFDNDVWEDNRFDIVVAGSIANFSQNPALKTYLMETGHKVLLEAAPTGTIWGVGLARDDERILDPRSWRGENTLGFALMKARAMLCAA
jgi:ribA/ribD-fused uncharacterized protein